IFNLYRVPAAGGALERVNNVITGAFEPTVSSDGAWIGWTTYSSWGFDVAEAPLSSLAPAPAEAWVDDRPAPPPPEPLAMRPLARYDPLSTLPPQTWMPFLTSDANGTAVGASSFGQDAVGRHGWALAASWGTVSGEPSAAASWAYRGWYPSL